MKHGNASAADHRRHGARAFFVLPLLWFVFAPFNDHATLSVTIPAAFSLANFQDVLDNDLAMRGLLQNTPLSGWARCWRRPPPPRWPLTGCHAATFPASTC